MNPLGTWRKHLAGGDRSTCNLALCPLRACLQGERVTLASGLKSALVYKQISQVGLPYHSGQLHQLYWSISSCLTFFVTSKIWKQTWSSLWKTGADLGWILTDFLNERRSRKLPPRHAPPGNCWLLHDVTKIQTTKLSILLKFYFHDVLEQLKTIFITNFASKGYWFCGRLRLNF